MSDEIEVTGLGNTPVDDWKEPTDAELDQPAIERLKPGSELHKKVLEYLKDRLKMSEDKMSALYPRWEANEMTLQAYITLPDYGERNKTSLQNKEPPKPAVITIPYAYATCMTIATYLLHVF